MEGRMDRIEALITNHLFHKLAAIQATVGQLIKEQDKTDEKVEKMTARDVISDYKGTLVLLTSGLAVITTAAAVNNQTFGLIGFGVIALGVVMYAIERFAKKGE
jgi:hypothetical protein